MPWCSRTAVNGIVCFSNTGTQSLAGHFTFHNWMTFLQEIPGAEDLQKGKVDSWVRSMAEDMSKYYEQTESLKSVLRARGLLKWVRHWDIKVLALNEFSTTHFANCWLHYQIAQQVSYSENRLFLVWVATGIPSFHCSNVCNIDAWVQSRVL